MRANQSITCCGIREIARVEDYNTPAEALVSLAKEMVPQKYVGYSYVPQDTPKLDKARIPRVAYLFFCTLVSAQEHEGKAPALAGYIDAHNLGTITAAPPSRNMNYPERKQPLQMFVWAPNWPAFKRWYAREYKRLHPKEVTRAKRAKASV